MLHYDLPLNLWWANAASADW